MKKCLFVLFLWLKQTLRIYFITYAHSRALNYFPHSCFNMPTQLSLCLSLPSSFSSFYIPQSIFIFSHSAHPILPHHFSPSLMGDRQNPSSKTLLVLSLSSFPINSLRWSSFLINRISHDTCRAGSVLITTQYGARMTEGMKKTCTSKTLITVLCIFVISNEAVRSHQHACLHKFQSTTCDRHKKPQHMLSSVMSAWIRMSWQSLKVTWLILRIRWVVIGFMWRCEITWTRRDACELERETENIWDGKTAGKNQREH